VDTLKRASGSTVEKLRGRMAQVFDWCVGYGHIEESPMPTNGVLASVLNTKRERKNHAALAYADVPSFVAGLPSSNAGACMQFLVLTAVRSNEARGCRWSEIDRDAAVWTIPASRMKSGREHKVPLSPAALDVLDSLSRRGEYVFPGRKTGSTLSDETLRALVKDRGVTTHGMRASFSTWAAEQTDVSRDVREASIAHKTEDRTSGAYQRSTFFDARAALMSKWADHVTSAAK